MRDLVRSRGHVQLARLTETEVWTRLNWLADDDPLQLRDEAFAEIQRLRELLRTVQTPTAHCCGLEGDDD